MLNMITHGFLVFHIIRNEVVGIRCSSSYRTEKYGESFKVEISNDLLQILGLWSDQAETIFMAPITTLTSSHNANVFALHPHHFIICCDLVDESILGGQFRHHYFIFAW